MAKGLWQMANGIWKMENKTAPNKPAANKPPSWEGSVTLTLRLRHRNWGCLPLELKIYFSKKWVVRQLSSRLALGAFVFGAA
jgi:hypothetical protein